MTPSSLRANQEDPITQAKGKWELMQQWLDGKFLNGMTTSYEARLRQFAFLQIEGEVVTVVPLSGDDMPVSRIRMNLVTHGRERLIEIIPVDVSKSMYHEIFAEHKLHISRMERAGTVNLDGKRALFTSDWAEPEARRANIRILPDEALRMLHSDRSYWQRAAMPDAQEFFDRFEVAEPRWGMRGEYVERIDRITSTEFKTDKDGDWVYWERVVLFSPEADWMPVRAWVEAPQYEGRPSPEAHFEWTRDSKANGRTPSPMRIGNHTLVSLSGSGVNNYDKRSSLKYVDDIVYWPKAATALTPDRADQLISFESEGLSDFESVMFTASNRAVRMEPKEWNTVSDEDLQNRPSVIEEQMAAHAANASGANRWLLGLGVLALAAIAAFILYRWKIA